MLEETPNESERTVELVVVINSYNRRALMEKAVTSLTQALRKAPFGSAAIVFEAGSNDGSREFLEDWPTRFPDYSLVVVESANERTSFAEGVNRGCAVALASFPACRWLLLYETDNFLRQVEPLSQAISLLQEEPKLAATGFTVKLHDGIFCGYGMRFPSWLSFLAGPKLNLRLKLDRPNDSPWQVTKGVRWRKCDIVFTSPLLIRREAWEQVGDFAAKDFPFSDSDLDWAWRCQESGWDTAVIASEDVVHDNLQQSSQGLADRVIDLHRSRLRLLKKHRRDRAAWLKPFLFLRHGLEAIVFAFGSLSSATAKAKLAQRRQMLRTVWTDYS